MLAHTRWEYSKFLYADNFDERSLFAALQGRKFDRWIDTVGVTTRTNGYSEGQLIENPAYIIESILRDEILAERDLELTEVGDTDTFAINLLRMRVNDYYNGAMIYNVTQNEKDYIIDNYQSGLNIVVGTFTTHPLWSESPADKLYVTNIQGDNKIDYASFDAIGNTTNGKRKDWVSRIDITEENTADSLLNELLFESRCILFSTNKKYKLVALDEETGSVDTWTEPLKSGGRYLFYAELTPLGELYNDFIIRYDMDYAAGDMSKNYFVNQNGYTASLTNGSTFQATCRDNFNTYRRGNSFRYDLKSISEDATAELFFDKIVNWHSKQRLVVNWSTPVSDYLEYEVGDQVILNNTKLIPTGINNSSKFMIFENKILPIPGAPQINFKLIEMTDA